jgi:hypothetical protein
MLSSKRDLLALVRCSFLTPRFSVHDDHAAVVVMVALAR